MTQTKTTEIDSEWDDHRFPRERRNGVVMGLDWDQIVVLLCGAGFTWFQAQFIVGVPLGFVTGLPLLVITALIGVLKPAGHSVPFWVFLWIIAKYRRFRGQLMFRRRVAAVQFTGIEDDPNPEEDEERDSQHDGDEADHDVHGAGVETPWRDKKGRIKIQGGDRFVLPGELAELRAYTLPGGPAFIYDPRAREAVLVAQVTTSKAFKLESGEEQIARTRGFRSGLTTLAGLKGVARWQTSDQTTLISGSRIEAWYAGKQASAPRIWDEEIGEEVPLSGERVDEFVHQGYLDLIRQANSVPVHEMWLSVVLKADQLTQQILTYGGGLRGFMEVAVGLTEAIESVVESAGGQVTGWHTARTVAGLSRTAFDPGSSLMVTQGDNGVVGADVSDAGPMAMDVYPDRLVSDSGQHRTFLVSEWPQDQVDLGFLGEFVFAGGFRHTVTMHYQPRPLAKAKKSVRERRASWRSAAKIRAKLDREEDEEVLQEWTDIGHEGQELARGFAAMKPVGLITVSAPEGTALEGYSNDVMHAATQANCQVRVLWNQQDAGFAASALPFGRIQVR
ncbi:SCO6880 family protein [Nesterenkonia sp. K-15-9-6]|uniref:SCO6880 family protein n=1 Tax=Nesterenkonia sp. K-15-9-6 TaxID=3093918 RepID=UPI004044D4FA